MCWISSVKIIPAGMSNTAPATDAWKYTGFVPKASVLAARTFLWPVIPNTNTAVDIFSKILSSLSSRRRMSLPTIAMHRLSSRCLFLVREDWLRPPGAVSSRFFWIDVRDAGIVLRRVHMTRSPCILAMVPDSLP